MNFLNIGFTRAPTDEQKKNITVILVKANTCPHCVEFAPFYDKIKEELIQSHSNISVLSFDITDETERSNLIKNYNYIYNANRDRGVPSVYCIKDNKYELIPHYNNNDDADPKSIFIKNFNNFIKSKLNKNSQIIQGGGSLNNNKYLKYKLKYLQLKNNM